MRVLFGMILGAILTVGVAYVHDTRSDEPVTTGSDVATHRNMVNWDVVDASWRTLRRRAEESWDAVTRR